MVFVPDFYLLNGDSTSSIQGGLLAQNFLRGISIVNFVAEIGAEFAFFRKFGANFRKKWPYNTIKVHFGNKMDSTKFPDTPRELSRKWGFKGSHFFHPSFSHVFGR